MVQVEDQVERHEETSDRFIHHASDWYVKGDLPQASEKAWGAVAHYLKAVAKSRGWSNSSHENLDEIVGDLAFETDDPTQVGRLYRSVSDLHRNFYNDSMPDAMVGGGIEDAIELLELLRNRTKPQPAERQSQIRRPIIDPFRPEGA